MIYTFVKPEVAEKVVDESANFIGFWPLIGAIISALICILLGSLLTPIIEPITHKIFSRINSTLFRKSKKLAGKWTHNWHVKSARFPDENITTNVSLKQFGKHISATYKVLDIDGKEFTYVINGKIEDNNYVRGEWFDLYSGNTYNGTFLLSINVNMDSMEGIWIGTSQDSKVKDGKWEWKRE